jgi:hypothetical protein
MAETEVTKVLTQKTDLHQGINLKSISIINSVQDQDQIHSMIIGIGNEAKSPKKADGQGHVVEVLHHLKKESTDTTITKISRGIEIDPETLAETTCEGAWPPSASMTNLLGQNIETETEIGIETMTEKIEIETTEGEENQEKNIDITKQVKRFFIVSFENKFENSCQ